VTIPYYPLSDEMLGKIVKLQLNRIKKRVEARYKIPFKYGDEVVKLVVSRCTESESGGRMIDAILTNTMLPDISREFLTRMIDGRERFEEAANAYSRCVALDPRNLEVYNNLGVLTRKLGQYRISEQHLLKAVALNPQFANAHINLGVLCLVEERHQEALSHFGEALSLDPQETYYLRLLARAYGAMGRLDDARATYLRWLEQAPGDPQALHLLAALGDDAPPERATNAYVEYEFDRFAETFDMQLAALGYRAPELVALAVERALGRPAAQCRMLDLGCGTGLCGPRLRPFASELVGVDLSQKMLSLAHARAVYDRLVRQELVDFLACCGDGHDAVVSADTLCYFGRLDEVFDGVHRSLRTGGVWVFTVESHSGMQDYVLALHGRYSHGRAYVEQQLIKAGFSRLELGAAVLRHENGVPVAGWIVSAHAGQQVL
jgi:predicted TPR repeat methyltransferase